MRMMICESARRADRWNQYGRRKLYGRTGGSKIYGLKPTTSEASRSLSRNVRARFAHGGADVARHFHWETAYGISAQEVLYAIQDLEQGETATRVKPATEQKTAAQRALAQACFHGTLYT
jgi:hypothetical protein